MRVIAACDPDLDAARATGAASLYSDHRELLSRASIDAVIVATPNHLHHEVVTAALAAGKHVLCEKPLAMNAVEATEMLACARRANRVHMTAFTYQFTPAIRYARHLIESGAIGEIRTVRAAYLMALSSHLLGWRSTKNRAGSGVLGDIGSHLIHLVQWIAGDIARVSARSRKFREDPASDVEDWVAFLAEFESGACGTFEISRVCPGRGADISENMFIELYGTRGSLLFSLQEPLTLRAVLGSAAGDPAAKLDSLPVPLEFLKIEGSPRNPTDGDPRWYYRFDQAYWFGENIRRGESRSPSFDDGVACQRVMDAVLESSAQSSWAPVAGPLSPGGTEPPALDGAPPDP
jgi:predicted dehydrogenase